MFPLILFLLYLTGKYRADAVGVCLHECGHSAALVSWTWTSETEADYPDALSSLPPESPVSRAGWTGTWESTWGWACRWIIDASSSTNDSLPSSSSAAIGSSYVKAAEARSVCIPVCLSVCLSTAGVKPTVHSIWIGPLSGGSKVRTVVPRSWLHRSIW